MEGPYGSPSREFYRYDNTIVFGAGIDITPFSAILFDLFDKINKNKSPWEKNSKNVRQYFKGQKHVSETTTANNTTVDSLSAPIQLEVTTRSARHLSQLKTILQKRSISLHWTVKSSQDLQWLSLLLNQLSSNLSVKTNIHLYVTQSDKGKDI